MKLAFTTLGCKVNQYETQALQHLLGDRGHSLAGAGETADAVIVNTCAVTAESGRKSRQAVRRARHDHPGAIVAVCGCFSQVSPEETEALGADLVYGSGERGRFVEDLERVWAERRGVTHIPDAMGRRTFEVLPSGGLEGRTRALLKVQDGCDNFCTYCIIPYARGPVRSMPLETVVEQARGLEAEGYRELVITGIEISSYGRERRDGTDLGSLITAVCAAVPGMRIRLGSLEPRTVTGEFCEKLRAMDNLCPHFHLSMQSGCDGTLARMGRRYDTARFYRSVEALRGAFPGCAVTTDMIVGFPGETEAEFGESLDFIRRCGFSAMHIFPYSPRPGTRAAEMPGQIEKGERARRARRAKAVAGEMRLAYLREQIGTVQPVLFETEEGGISRGHAPNYCRVETAATGLRGQVAQVAVHSVSDEILTGEMV